MSIVKAPLRPAKNMRVTFWGVRGSVPIFPTPREIDEYARRIAVGTVTRVLEDMAKKARDGRCSVEDLIGNCNNVHAVADYQRRLGLPELPSYGGETTCVEVETEEGNTIIFDAGSGVRLCALNLVNRWVDRKDRRVHLFGSHEHLDHRSGLALARFCYVKDPPFHFQVFGSYQFLKALDERYGIFSREISATAHSDDPVDFRFITATFNGVELRDPAVPSDPATDRPRPWDVRETDRPIQIGKTTVTPFDLYHGPTRCLGYKVQHNDSTFVFCTDHEIRHGIDPHDERQKKSEAAEARVIEHSINADVAYFDGQYFLSEYLGLKGIGMSPAMPRMDWGHGCIEDLLSRVQRCKIKRTFIGHHDPDRDWPEQVQMDNELSNLCQGKPYCIELAKGGTVVDL